MPGPHASVSLSANLKQQHPAPTTPATSASARAESPGCFTFHAPSYGNIDLGSCQMPRCSYTLGFYFLIIRINIPLHRFGGSHGLHLQLRFAVVGVLALIEGAGHGDPCVRGKSVGLRPLADEAARCKVGGTAGHNQPRGNELVCVHLTAGFIHLARYGQCPAS